ncbi:gamma-glutamyl-gamma-aminobutyrate hydrolase family protein [Kiloniella laminariae]|uniref:Gamma-glutamyl-gamma-aminobutyrate hydrolase family protein n=1 Tax=Kiloniella laminariae TaxID=454162 RepID=A0ABT4LP47_9PROT|nr:gamma-glutamyl-gamma-aminobutyrate hydrolase family protein [Kiloniella laminariae]MCZ4282889.1 gamma-glutamyl-gamma-aminobutyrate hydrolase family protein [Kiloniella laminariae]
MRNKILLVDHAGQPREDRVSKALVALGHDIEWCCPVKGDLLPDDFDSYRAAIVYGGMECANDPLPHLDLETDWIARWVRSTKPYLGICLGGQLLAKALGGKVYRHAQAKKEIGFYQVKRSQTLEQSEPGLFHDCLGELPEFLFQWHEDGFELPGGACNLAGSELFPSQAFVCRGEGVLENKVIGLQFHPEVTREIATVWLDTFPAALEASGAQSRDEIEQGFLKYDPAVDRWAKDFLAHWLG